MSQCVSTLAIDAQGAAVANYIDLSRFWPSDFPISEAARRTNLDRRTLSAAKKGFLDRCQVDTLVALQKLASELQGEKVSLEDMIVYREEPGDQPQGN